MKQLFYIFFFILVPIWVFAQKSDSTMIVNDSIDFSSVPVKKQLSINDLLKQHIFLNSTGKPVQLLQQPRKFIRKDAVFYILSIILLTLGFLKVSYSRYFNNLIRVFFNTSLRQSQLTDQLLQAKLPSMFFNLFFIIISGCYLFLLLNFFGRVAYNNGNVLLICVLSVLGIYLLKFWSLKFAGWLTGYRHETDTYIFIVFLINKIIALGLAPVVVIMAFSNAGLVKITVLVSFLMIAVMLLMRFFRSYGLLQTKLRISGLHFLLYLAAVELLPLLLIYKAGILIMSKNL